MAPVLHLQPPCGGSLAPDADAWALATSLLPPHVAPRRCHCPACWVARHAPKSLRSSAPSREPATVAAILARSSGPSWGPSTMAATLARAGGPSWRCPSHCERAARATGLGNGARERRRCHPPSGVRGRHGEQCCGPGARSTGRAERRASDGEGSTVSSGAAPCCSMGVSGTGGGGTSWGVCVTGEGGACRGYSPGRPA